MNTYEVTYSLTDGTVLIDTVVAKDKVAARDDVRNRHADADIWGARAMPVVYGTDGQTPCDEAVAKIAEEVGNARRWDVTVTCGLHHMQGEVIAVTDTDIVVHWYDRAHGILWADVNSITITPRF